MNRYYEPRPDVVKVVGTTITATSLSSASAVLTLTNERRIIVVFNNCDQAVSIGYRPEVQTDRINFLHLESDDQVVLDFQTSGIRMSSGSQLFLYNAGTTPTTGSVRISAF